ncbi:hypothetical protein CY34DRAFT_813368, partial [Suillus luteus UH-Slu-Lm8-n1]
MITPVYEPLPYALSGFSFTQQVGIQISNIGSIAILWLVYMWYITEAFLVLSAVLSICALSVFPIV